MSPVKRPCYRCCVYLRFRYSSGRTVITLVAGKSRVKPLSKQSIPRLELLGTLLLARLVETVKNELNSVYCINEVHLWTDSTIAYCWIKNFHKEYKTFVQNRVNEIRKLTTSMTWHLIPSKLNPADIISKGCVPGDLGDLRFSGPTFLTLPETHWPQLVPGESFIKEDQEEKTGTAILTAPVKIIVENLEEIIPSTKFNSFDKLARVTAWVLRFVRKLKNKKVDNNITNKNEYVEKKNCWLSVEEIQASKNMWIKQCQRNLNNQFDKLDKNLETFYDETQLLRCKGRLSNASISYDARFPVLLPRGRLAYIITLDVHSALKHAGVRQTLTEMRKKFWIIKGRNFVRKTLHDCRVCRKFDRKAYRYPPTPSLPEDRVKGEQAYKAAGIDYAGPLHVRNVYGEELTTFKSWIALMTCAASRAVHLDLASDSSGEECVEVLKRFISRLGAPDIIRSDNGKNFISEEVQNFATSKNIDWKFNLEAAPWQGGFWERLVGSVKRPLRKVLGKATLRYNEMLTVLSEIEVILNNRPLTYLYVDEVEEPLTPNHLIFGHSLNLSAERIPQTDDMDKRFRFVNTLLEHFWKCWSSEYLQELREHWKNSSSKSKRYIQENDVVLIFEDKRPRSQWRLGKVVELIHGRDGCVRGAVLQTCTKEGRRSKIRRPVNRLIPLEEHLTYESKDEKYGEMGVNGEIGENEMIKIRFVDDKDVKLHIRARDT